MTDRMWWLIAVLLTDSVIAQGVAEADFFAQVQKLAPPYAGDAAPFDEFGKSVDISGDLMLVGMPGDDDATQPGFSSGSALVFRRDGANPGQWVLEAKLVPGQLGGAFGLSVAIDGEVAAVGAPQTNGAGAVYLYSFNTGGVGAWGLITTLEGAGAQSSFGAALDLSDQSLIVGAPTFSDTTSNRGEAYIFSRNEGGDENWGQTGLLEPDPARVANSTSGGYAFGTSVAIAGGQAAVGAVGDDLLPTTDSGAIYTYVLDAGNNTWLVDELLEPATPMAGGRMSTALALEPNTLVAGGSQATSVEIYSRSTGIWQSVRELPPPVFSVLGAGVALNGDVLAASDTLNQTVTLFERNRGGIENWGEITTLNTTQLQTPGPAYARSIGLSGGTLAVGAPNNSVVAQVAGSVAIFQRSAVNPDVYEEQSFVSAGISGSEEGFGNSTAVDGAWAIIASPQGYEQAQEAGVAFIYQRVAGIWQPAVTLQPTDLTANNRFGYMVDLSGSVATVVRDGGFPRQVYVFEKDLGGVNRWGQRTVLVPQSGGDDFSVSIDGDTVAVGDYLGANATSDITGAVEIFQRNEGGADQWGRVTTITPEDVTGRVFFGWAVDLDGDRLVVGAINDDEAGMDVGAAYIFERNRGGQDNWGEVTRLEPSDTSAQQNFGSSVAVSGNTVAVSAPNFASSEGAVYVFVETSTGNWVEQRQRGPLAPASFSFFGNMLQLNGDTLIVSDENYADPNTVNSVPGSVEVLQRNSGGPNNWGTAKRLLASDASNFDGFGGVLNSGYTNRGPIGFDGKTIMVGAFGVDTDNEDVGASYVYFTDLLLRDGFEEP